MKLVDHPTVRAYNEKKIKFSNQPDIIESAWVKQVALESGADDAGVIDLSRESISRCRHDLLDVMPDTQSILVMVFRVNQNNLRSLAHSVTDYEFKQMWSTASQVGKKVVNIIQQKAIKAISMPVGFPQEASRWPGKIWLTEDKVFAAEAGLGHMGYNRLVIHPEYGASIILGSILLSAKCDHYDQPIGFNPCIKCGLCLKACPVGAVKSTDNFDMLACLTHNYRERLGGFQNWVEQVVESKNTADYRSRVSDTETVSMWQHLAIGAQNRCDRCMAVCPAGEVSIGEYLDDRKAYNKKYVKRFRDLSETVYVVKGSAAEKHVQSNFPGKKIKCISNGIRPVSAERFLTSLPLAFQPAQSEDLDATYHFSFTGRENVEGTVIIKDKNVTVQKGLEGVSDLHLTADSQTWIKFLTGETGLLKALITRKIKMKGSVKLMKAFAKCFPS